jgi:hypothetical protein
LNNVGRILSAGRSGIDRIQISVLKVLVGAAVKTVSAADDIGVELAAGRMAELRGELVGEQGKLARRIVGDGNERSGHALVVIVDAFNGVVVVARPLAADGRSRAVPNTATGCHTGAEE